MTTTTHVSMPITQDAHPIKYVTHPTTYDVWHPLHTIA